jgi:hypothetical protein
MGEPADELMAESSVLADENSGAAPTAAVSELAQRKKRRRERKPV